MALGFFAGNAAKSTADTLFKWKQLWDRQEAREQEQEFREKQLAQAKELQIDQQGFSERMARLQNEWAEGRMDRNELFEVSKIALNQMPNLGLDQQWDMVEELEKLGSPLAGTARNTVRTTLFDNPDEAFALVDSVFTAPPGTKFNDHRVNTAVDMYIARSGMPAGEAEEFKSDVETLLGNHANSAEELDQIALGRARTSLDQAHANVAQTITQNAQISAETAAILQDTEFEADKHPLVLENLETTNRLLALDETRAEIENGALPAEIGQRLRLLSAQAQEVENGNEMYDATFDAVVQQVVAQSDLTVEEARHMVATGPSRDAIVEGNLEELRATISYITTQEESLEARTDLTRTEIEVLGLGMSETRIDLINEMVAEGNVEMLGEFGPDLLQHVPEEERAALLEELTGVAGGNRSRQERREMAAILNSEAQAEYNQFLSDTAEGQQLFERWLAIEGLEDEDARIGIGQQNADTASTNAETAQERLTLDEFVAREQVRLADEGLDIDRGQLRATLEELAIRRSAALSNGAPDVTSVDEAIAELQNGGAPSTADLFAQIEEVNTLGGQRERVLAALESGDGATIRAIAGNYGYTNVEGMDPEALGNTLAEDLLLRAQAKQGRVENGILRYVRGVASMTGQIVRPQDLGFEDDTSYFWRSATRIPGVSGASIEDENSFVLGAAEGVVLQMAPIIAADGVSMGAGDTLMSTLVDRVAETAPEGTEDPTSYAEHLIAQAGVTETDLQEMGNQTVSEYQATERNVGRVAQVYAGITGEELDITDYEDREVLENFASHSVDLGEQARQALSNVPNGANPGFVGTLAQNVGDAVRPGDQRGNRLELEAAAVDALTNLPGVTEGELVEMGILSERGTLLDRGAAQSFLSTYIGNAVNSQTAIQDFDLWPGQ